MTFRLSINTSFSSHGIGRTLHETVDDRYSFRGAQIITENIVSLAKDKKVVWSLRKSALNTSFSSHGIGRTLHETVDDRYSFRGAQIITENIVSLAKDKKVVWSLRKSALNTSFSSHGIGRTLHETVDDKYSFCAAQIITENIFSLAKDKKVVWSLRKSALGGMRHPQKHLFISVEKRRVSRLTDLQKAYNLISMAAVSFFSAQEDRWVYTKFHYI